MRVFCCVLFVAICVYFHTYDFLIGIFAFIDDQHQKETEELEKEDAEIEARQHRERENFFTACINLSLETILTLSLIISVVKSVICNKNTQVGGQLFLAAGSLTHVCLTSRIVPSPLSVC